MQNEIEKIDASVDESDDDSTEMISNELLKPQALKGGSRVALVAPGSRPTNPSELKKCIAVVEEMGFTPVVGKHVLKYDGFCAGTDDERLDDIQSFLLDPSVEALFCVTGGYGALRLLPLLDFKQIRDNPKIFIGSGDNDSILLSINKLTGLVVFHGSNLDEIEDKHSFESARAALLGNDSEKTIYCRLPGEPAYNGVAYPINERRVEGRVCGGNLTSLCSLFGTKYQPDFDGKVLLLDDFTERNSLLDRWFTSLYLAGVLSDVAGIAFGGFPSVSARGADNMLSIEDTFGDRLKGVGTASCFGFKFGQATNDNVMPIGINAELDCAAGKLKYLEPALS